MNPDALTPEEFRLSVDIAVEDINRGVAWHPGDASADPPALPALEVGGALVFAYVRPVADDAGTVRLELCVSVHLDNATELLRESDAVPVRVAVENVALSFDHAGVMRLDGLPSGKLTFTPNGG